MKNIGILALLLTTLSFVSASDNDIDKEILKQRISNDIVIYDPVFRNADIMQQMFCYLDEPSQRTVPNVCAFWYLTFKNYVDETHKHFPNKFENLSDDAQQFVSQICGKKASCKHHIHLPALNFINTFEQNNADLYNMHVRLPKDSSPSFIENFMTHAVDFGLVGVLVYSFEDFVQALANLPAEKLDVLWSHGASLFQNIHPVYWQGCLTPLASLEVGQLKALGSNHQISQTLLEGVHGNYSQCISALQPFSIEQMNALGYSSSLCETVAQSIASNYNGECLSALSTLTVKQIYALGRNTSIFQNVENSYLTQCFSSCKDIAVEHIDLLGLHRVAIFSGVKKGYHSQYLLAIADLPKEKMPVLFDNLWIFKKTKLHPDDLRILNSYTEDQLKALGRNEVILQDIEGGSIAQSLRTLATCSDIKIDALGRNAVILQDLKAQVKEKGGMSHTISYCLEALSTCSIDHLDILGSKSTSIFQGVEECHLNNYISTFATFSVDQLKALVPQTWIFEKIKSNPDYHLKKLHPFSVEQLEALGRNAAIFRDVDEFALEDYLKVLKAFSGEQIDVFGRHPAIFKDIDNFDFNWNMKALPSFPVQKLEPIVQHFDVFQKIGDSQSCLNALKDHFTVEQLHALGRHGAILEEIPSSSLSLERLSEFTVDQIDLIGKNVKVLLPGLVKAGSAKITAMEKLQQLEKEALESKSTS